MKELDWHYLLASLWFEYPINQNVDLNFYATNNKVQLYSTGRYSQYPVINRNGKEYKQGYVSVCVTESLCSAAETNTTL